MALVLGMLEEREATARVRVEGLREEVARLAGALETAEIELDRRVIAREEPGPAPELVGGAEVMDRIFRRPLSARTHLHNANDFGRLLVVRGRFR
ncbi:hypothetical protein [Streptomyces broussonetiae]|uniref:hypothetical protein n=1 Tax=Streptomyces broussonetiae TaxID=2686304 RepID=UPI0018EF159A|nr:hypothetical protein [Streptomyces broussonetiae]